MEGWLREVSSLIPLEVGCLNGWMVLSSEKEKQCRRESITHFLIYSM